MDGAAGAPRLASLHDRDRRGAGIHRHRDPGSAVSAPRRQVEVRTCHRIPVGVLDMLSVWFELRFGQKPLLLFGMLGAGLFAIGALAGLIALGVLLRRRRRLSARSGR